MPDPAESANPRYLAPFHPKRIPHHFVDVLIVGGGIAGLRAAMACDPRLSVLIVTKDHRRESNSTYAQGGIAGVLDPEDNFANHVRDTLVAGANLCDPDVVDLVVREAPAHIRELMAWGAQFDLSDDGELLLGREGGHSHNRIAHALGDATGREIMRAMWVHARETLRAQVWENTFTIDLLTTPSELTGESECRGALVWSPTHGKTFVWAKQTILATGGAGQVFRETTNPAVATGDGHAIAYRAGAELADMEFMQFHPTVLYIAGSSRSLITEAMRGEGAWLIDADGHRFMPEYDERAELAPRDIVSRAIVHQMEKTRRPSVFLDLRHLDAEHVRARFPGIAKSCLEFGIDIATDPIPVRPGAHYLIGGVRVDEHAATTLPRLWAAGEATSSGLHGANRLASNSLLEGLVYGHRAGQGAAAAALEEADTFRAIPLVNEAAPKSKERLDLADIRNSLKSLMWLRAGVWREADGLAEAAESIQSWRRYVLTRQLTTPDGWELQNLLQVAELMIRSATKREESRGVHLRNDFPQPKDAEWRRRVTVRRAATGPQIELTPLLDAPPAPAA
ncbi:L-aspartate oxidase [Botrimarina colliarenosi]|uniref:L-aspartate oxidase n=1 Tax=Botrimarina colliarenosi TaxID=2528001 RepID=A0A5C6AHW9_9BACT|nr:L-aspartate oxidase [Botrimarina colliarenosi]TWT99077.1 L-aspartate oxidase [Botrimarina colliarenosi]